MPELPSLVVTREHVQVEEEKYLTLSTEFRFGKDTANIPMPQSERDDDWFVVLDVVPRTSLVPEGIALLFCFICFLD